VAALLRALDKYPYGCIEQTTSRALPLLYYNDVALLGYGPSDPKISDRVQEAVYRIVDMQAGDGSFGMWGPFSSPAAEWLQSYALDFLLRARDQQMAVRRHRCSAASPGSAARPTGWPRPTPRPMLGTCFPRRASPMPAASATSRRQGRRDQGRAGWAQLAAALKPGRRARPRAPRLRAGATPSDERDPHDYYGTPLRDRAALLALASEAGGARASPR